MTDKKPDDGKIPREKSEEKSEEKSDDHLWNSPGYAEGKLSEILELPASAHLVILVASSYEIECKGAGIYKELVQRFTGGNNQPFGNLSGDEYYLHLRAGEGDNWIVEYITEDGTETELSIDTTAELADKLNAFDIEHRKHGAT